jgi:tetratricopeptide (TPR) repeat protein
MHDRRRTLGLLATVVIAVAGVLAGCSPDPSFYQRRGLQRYQQLNRPDAARADFARAVEINPTFWNSHYHLGLIALQQGDTAIARRHLEVALALVRDKPKLAKPIVDALAEAIFQQDDYPRLIGFLNEVTDQYATLHDFLRRARYYEKMADHDNAQIAYRQAIKIATAEDVTPFLALADFYLRIGATDQALATLRQAYSLAPAHEEISKRIRELGEVPGPTLALPPQR